jgi:RimJ/RimL family protein N-acetyltransferase
VKKAQATGARSCPSRRRVRRAGPDLLPRPSPTTTATARPACPANLLQAQRDYFGAHTYERVDQPRIARGLQSSADANWWISSEFLRQGYGKEGVDAMLRNAFGDLPSGLGLHTVHAGIAPDNLASIRLARALGFRHESGVQSYLRIGERWELHDIYSLTVLDAHALAG